MADSGGDSETLSEGTHEPRECMACRGTGRVISNLGGSQSTVSCPWCGGSGLRQAELDAQAHWPRAESPEQTGESPEQTGEPREQTGEPRERAADSAGEQPGQTPDAPDGAA